MLLPLEQARIPNKNHHVFLILYIFFVSFNSSRLLNISSWEKCVRGTVPLWTMQIRRRHSNKTFDMFTLKNSQQQPTMCPMNGQAHAQLSSLFYCFFCFFFFERVGDGGVAIILLAELERHYSLYHVPIIRYKNSNCTPYTVQLPGRIWVGFCVISN